MKLHPLHFTQNIFSFYNHGSIVMGSGFAGFSDGHPIDSSFCPFLLAYGSVDDGVWGHSPRCESPPHLQSFTVIELAVIQFFVETVGGKKSVVCALFNDLSVPDHQYEVGIADCR